MSWPSFDDKRLHRKSYNSVLMEPKRKKTPLRHSMYLKPMDVSFTDKMNESFGSVKNNKTVLNNTSELLKKDLKVNNSKV